MNRGFIAKASAVIDAPISLVWNALTTPEFIKQYMFGTTVVTDWQVGSPIVWRGEWQGKSYEDKGKVLRFEEERALSYSHFSTLSGRPDNPENYHTVMIELERKGNQTVIALTQDNNTSTEARDHSQKNWEVMLDGLKKLLEGARMFKGGNSPTPDPLTPLTLRPAPPLPPPR
jgi:uncharacterized protein YndB with AHSA1/START domain